MFRNQNLLFCLFAIFRFKTRSDYYFLCLSLLLVLGAPSVSYAQDWSEASFRGTPNNWGATPMTKNTVSGLWETEANFAGDNPRFKISRSGNNWNEAYPTQDYPIAQGEGDYRIAFNDVTKAIGVTKLAVKLSANTICYNNSANHANPTLYYWNPLPATRLNNLPGWPGRAMVQRGNFYCYDFSADLPSGVMPDSLRVIFSNNGAAQTADLTYSGAGCFENGTWKTLQACGFSLTDSSSSTSSVSSASSSSSIPGLPIARPQLAAPLNFPITGNVSTGDYRFEKAYPNLDDQFPSPMMVVPDGINDLIYVADKVGSIFVFPNDTDVTKPEVRTLLNINDQVRNYHEQGLLSMAFDPEYATNGYFYIYYIHGTDDNERAANGKYGDAILERWTVNDPFNPTAVLTNSNVEILRVAQPGPDHKGGMMQFHPEEGYLYLSIGDGAYGHSAITSFPVDPRTNNNAQITTNLLGTMIRIQLLDTPIAGKYYATPADNPFVDNAGFRPEIWSYGHRNPWRWAFDTETPYTLWQTEVGQSGVEEVNLIQKGKNYGWPVCEGVNNRGELGGDPTKNCSTDFEPPRDGYNHPTGFSIIGGVVYRGNKLPNLNGSFIFGDYVTKRIWSIVDGQPKELISDAFPENIVSFGTDLSGEELLVSTYGVEYGGRSTIYKVVDDAAASVAIPATLSATGLFSDLENLIPVTGVIEYSLNTQGWFDGAEARHFMAIPNETQIGFDPLEKWNLPVGSVLVKHLSIATENNAQQPFTTSVLFRQESGWQAANYRWNSAGTDAALATETQTVLDGGIINRQRAVQSAADCGSCHVGSGSKNPLALHTRQLNREFSYQDVSENQLNVFNQVGLFNVGIDHASQYDAFAAVDDASVEPDVRVKAYLDTNCAHCHASSFMDLRYDTPLTQMRLLDVVAGGDKARVQPGHPQDSVVYIYQTSDGNRMPKGTRYTNAAAENLFAQWIADLPPSSSSSSSSASSASTPAITAIEIAPDPVALGDAVTSTQQLVAYGVRSDDSRANLYGQVNWQIVSGAEAVSITPTGLLTRLAPGAASVQASFQNLTTTVDVTSLASGLSLRYDNPNGWNTVRIYLWTTVNGVDQQVAPWPGTLMSGPTAVDGKDWWSFVIDPQHLHNGSINVIFTNGNGAQTGNLLNVAESSSYSNGAWIPWNPTNIPDGELTRLSVIAGTTATGERDFPAGSVVTVNADTPPFGTTFTGWSGDALPYIFTNPSDAQVQLVIPDHGLALQAIFNNDTHIVGRDFFASQCANCHGANGSGGVESALDAIHLSSAWTLEILADYINDFMPLGTSGQCTGTDPGGCAYAVANMMMANAWIAPNACTDASCTAGASLDARNLRLLTREEYLNSVRDIFAMDFPATLMNPVPADGRIRNFDTASFLVIDIGRNLGYEMVAADVAEQVLAQQNFGSLVNACTNNACVVSALGKKLFRRALTTTEVNRYLALFDSSDGGRTLVQALLMSPHFMYRSELGKLNAETGLYELTDYEIATLLSYTFWVSAPDDALLAAAGAGILDIAAQVERLLADPRAERGLRRFAGGWLIDNQYGFAGIQNPTLVEAFKEETIRFVIAAIQQNKSFNSLLTANYTLVNNDLAQHYGMAPVPGDNWVQAFYNSGDPRSGAGLLGHSSFLASRTNTVNPAPIKRGVYVRQVIMCQEFPPPAAADFNVVFEPGDSNRDATARHTSDPACASCHQYIDGVGFGFESFGSDALFRTIEMLGNGETRAVDASGAIKSLYSAETTLDPNSASIPYNSIPELAELIASSGQGEACYSRQFYRYTVGRNETLLDEPIIRSYSTDVRSGGGLRDMLIDLTLAESFILRR